MSTARLRVTAIAASRRMTGRLSDARPARDRRCRVSKSASSMPIPALDLPRGEEGMIEVRGYVTRGYVGYSESQTTDAISPDGFFRTGDMGRLLPDGTISFSGRVTEMIKKSGINISPAEVEDVLMRHATVALAGVVGVPDATQGELLAAFVVAKPEQRHGPRNSQRIAGRWPRATRCPTS